MSGISRGPQTIVACAFEKWPLPPIHANGFFGTDPRRPSIPLAAATQPSQARAPKRNMCRACPVGARGLHAQGRDGCCLEHAMKTAIRCLISLLPLLSIPATAHCEARPASTRIGVVL